MREPIDLIVACAMKEEAAPFLSDLDGSSEPFDPFGPKYRGPTAFHRGNLGSASALIITSGIGTTNAAVAITAALQSFESNAVIVAGTAGGLARNIAVNDIVIAQRALYHEANATEFGYEPGQLPQMPPWYEADPALLVLSEKVAEESGARSAVGTVASSNSFVTATLADGVRATFPDLLAVDMETAAIAQVCWMFGVPWVSVRAVSDLCDPEGFSQFRTHADEAYQTSYKLARAMADAMSHNK